jgi:hypothetical protein
MVIEFKAEGQKHPLLVKVKGTQKLHESITVDDIIVDKITRKVVMSPQPLDEHGQLFFEIVDGPFAKLGLGMLWAHLLDREFVDEVRYPGGSNIEKPRKSEVTVHKMQNGIAIDVDAMQYYFPYELNGRPHLADPFIKDITNPKELIARVIEDLLGRPEDKRPKK